MAKYPFQTEVSRLLHLIIHSLYSHPEIFLRELVSNASDALDRLKYLSLTDERYKGFPFIPRIDIAFDEKDRKWLTVCDTGIGMSGEELAADLGTIANSGTRQFLQNLSEDAQKASNLIGQFGVGFYSCFMVADRVEVTSRKAGEEEVNRWSSDGQGEFEVQRVEENQQGTTVKLFLNERGREYADRWRIQSIVRKYSNHIAFPIYLHYTEDKKERVEQINAASALWRRPKAEISDQEYKDFYKSISHDEEDPLHFLHTQAEGALEYTTLFYIPQKAPPDLFWVNYRPGVKLYIKRVFITDDEKELMPTYLRFLVGVIDSEDLPLNVSRQMLQENQVLRSIRAAAVKKVLAELARMAQNTPEKYERFHKEFGVCLKEGLYQDLSNREELLELVRYKSSTQKGITGLAAYKERMGSEQKAIYYLAGENEQKLRSSPLLEAYTRKGIEVLLMDDAIDELVAAAIGSYKGLELKAINRSGSAEELKTEEDRGREKDLAPLLKKLKGILAGEVKDVRASARLADSPACIVIDDNDPTLQIQQLARALGQKELPEVKPILELNPRHPVVEKLQTVEDEALLADVSRLLLEQALIQEGVQLKEPFEFSRRLSRLLSRAL